MPNKPQTLCTILQVNMFPPSDGCCIIWQMADKAGQPGAGSALGPCRELGLFLHILQQYVGHLVALHTAQPQSAFN